MIVILTDEGQQRLVRHGRLPEREIMAGIGPVGVCAPRVRDRVGQGEARIRFSSAILPPYARRSKSLEVLIPILYLKGISMGDFEEALAALLGKDAGGPSASTIARLKDAWVDEHVRWSKRDLTAKRYVYFWVDGIHVQARLPSVGGFTRILLCITILRDGLDCRGDLCHGTRTDPFRFPTLALDRLAGRPAELRPKVGDGMKG